MAHISEMNRIYKTNMTDVFDLPVLLKKNATTKYFREIFEKARKKGIYKMRPQEVDKDNGVFFEVEMMEPGRDEPVRYRYTFCFQFCEHSYDDLYVTK